MNAPSDTIKSENPAADSGRNAKGQFAPGNKGGPGNPFCGKIANFRKAVLLCITPQDISAIVRGLIDMAVEGHYNAAKLILMYYAGKPDETPPPEAWDCYRDAMTETPPSTNGDVGREPPSTNGESSIVGKATSLPENDGKPEACPTVAPSTNGDFTPPPSPNGDSRPKNRKQRRALAKARRIEYRQGRGGSQTPDVLREN